ncbi:signal peptidase I [Dermatophilaceae bacterium Soc4.6]
MPHETHEPDARDPEGRRLATTLGVDEPQGTELDGPQGYDDDDLDESDLDDPGREGGGFAGLIDNILGGLREILIIAVMAVVLSFVVKTWLIQAFYIPSASMENTLVKDDRVIVSKLTPGPVDLQRGDIVVFQDPDHWLPAVPTVDQPGLRGTVHRGLQFIGLLPDESDDHLIKRVIGLPGDHIVGPAGGGRITVNGAPITETYVKTGDVPNGNFTPFDITVPAGRVWVMGDHRGDSADSRFHDDGTGAKGSVPIADITGRAVTIVWPIDHVRWLSVPSGIYAKIPNLSPSSTPKPSVSSAP